jgi:hypothetical protein
MVKSCTVEPEVFGMTEDQLDSLERALTRINETVMSGSIFRNCITQVSPRRRPRPWPAPPASARLRRACMRAARARVNVHTSGRSVGRWACGWWGGAALGDGWNGTEPRRGAGAGFE